MLATLSILTPAAAELPPWLAAGAEAVVGNLRKFNYTAYMANQLAKFEPKTAKHLRPDGSFDYLKASKQYQGAQFKVGGVSPESMRQVAQYIKGNVPLVKRFALCHGTNAGYEMQWLRNDLPGTEVIGTELAPLTAKLAKYTVNWDFHVVKPEWRAACDFVYSNAIDHSPNPELAVTRWMEEVRPGGVLILEWSRFSAGKTQSKTDLFGASLKGYLSLIKGAGSAVKPPFGVRTVFNNSAQMQTVTSAKDRRFGWRHWIVVQHTS